MQGEEHTLTFNVRSHTNNSALYNRRSILFEMQIFRVYISYEKYKPNNAITMAIEKVHIGTP